VLRITLKPWPYVTKAERRTVKKVAALLPGAAGTPSKSAQAAARPSTTRHPLLSRC
jgi:hypothetical protein